MNDVVAKLWGYCNTLRHDGINYGGYIEQLTYLLFLKLASEKGLKVPKGCDWFSLKSKPLPKLIDSYNRTLRTLAKQEGILKDIFTDSLCKFREPVNLKKLIELIDETEWSSLDIDLKAQAYEGLLQKYAAEQKGAGQYFTPREAIRSIVRCIQPDFRVDPNYSIHDPACGTAGFLIGAKEWIMHATHNGEDLTIEEKERLAQNTFSGVEIVLEARRLGLMNLYLHDIVDGIRYGDALAEKPNKQYNCIITNPPFGSKSAGDVPARDDFLVRTTNKQLNFLQHILSILKPNGKAAVVLPDNVLFEEHAGHDIREFLLTTCNLHTILRLPIGTFTPYSTGVKANVLFFDKGLKTENIWVYDLRHNFEKITKGNGLTDDVFKDFELNFKSNPRKENERFKKITISEVQKRDYNLDIPISLICADKKESNENLENLIGTAISELNETISSLNKIMEKLSCGEQQKVD